MKIKAIRSDYIYQKMVSLPADQKDEMFRKDLMGAFAFKWQCVGVPLKAQEENGYDVIKATNMGGSYLPSQITQERQSEINLISNEHFWNSCQNSIEESLEGFEQHGIKLPVQDYVFTILLNDPKHPMSDMTGDYCGDGGIPGYIIGTIIPNAHSLEMLPVALAHEANHNVRWQFIKWSQEITLADMIVSEGIAESFAAIQFGEEKVGDWVKKTSKETLEDVIKPVIKDHLQLSDFSLLSSYLYGDDIMKMRNGKEVGMPYCAGYACGYHLIQHYLKKTGSNIYEATIIPTAKILEETEDFWK